MMKRFAMAGVGVAVLWLCGAAVAATPVVSNVRASQRAGTKLVDIYYDVSDADGHSQTVQVLISGDAGLTYRIPAISLSGNVGSGVAVGTNRHIVWNAGLDWNGQYVDKGKIRIVSNDGVTPVPPFNMAYIPAGPFLMGTNPGEGDQNERPVHTVEVAAFFMDKYEVSYGLWADNTAWSASHGYSIGGGGGNGADHPVHSFTWYDAVKWCNARSEREGLTPVYYTDAAQTTVYRSGNVDVSNASVKWDANGYRLPTEAEWEKAARGGLSGQRYPWGDEITGSDANYSGSGDPWDNSTTPCGYYNGTQTPAGPDRGNGYGLYDMAGNVWEWCWDWHDGTYYGWPSAGDNPKGPDTGSARVLRGGSWLDDAGYLRCAFRVSVGPGNVSNGSGLRCVRGL